MCLCLQMQEHILLQQKKLNLILVNWERGARMLKRRGLLEEVADEVAKYAPHYMQASQSKHESSWSPSCGAITQTARPDWSVLHRHAPDWT